MLRSRFSWKLYATYVFAILLTAGAIGVLTLGQLERVLLREKEEALRLHATAFGPVAREVFEGARTGAQELVVGLGEATGVRITLIAWDGQVLADSFEHAAEMDDHGDRPEVARARETGLGRSRRHSRTLEQDYFYLAYAVRGEAGEGLGIVRTSMPVSTIDEQRASMQRTLGIGTALGVLGALLLGGWLTRRISRPVEDLTHAANELRQGRYDTRVTQLPRDEFGVLGDALNRLGSEVTQRVQDLSGEEARLRAILAGMVEGVLAVDGQDRVSFSNDAARRLFGVEDLDGRRLWRVVRVAGLDSLIQEARSSHAAARRELVFEDRSGREVILRAQAHRFWAEERIGIVVVLHDVTEVRRLESIRRDFVANVSHELKTPLTSIRGYVETLLDGAIDDQEHNVRFLEKIDTHVGRLNHLVGDLLSLARIEEQDDGLELVLLELGPVVEATVRMHEEAARSKDVRVRVELDPGMPSVLADRESLIQVISNLVDNAIKYSPSRGSVVVRIVERAGGVAIEVEDNGAGIPAEDLDRVFERFYRVDKARARELGGTGLGLSIVKHLVQGMGGTVEVESQVGVGTTFRVVLPLQPDGRGEGSEPKVEA